MLSPGSKAVSLRGSWEFFVNSPSLFGSVTSSLSFRVRKVSTTTARLCSICLLISLSLPFDNPRTLRLLIVCTLTSVAFPYAGHEGTFGLFIVLVSAGKFVIFAAISLRGLQKFCTSDTIAFNEAG